jgi:membrane protein DedA with SNARE-associated domain
MNLEQIIAQYGYLGVGVGTFLQSEALLFAGGISAHRGYLDLTWVIVCAFIGTLSGNQLYFYIGQRNGKRLLQNRPNWKTKSAQVQAMLSRHEWLLLLTYRFVPGLAKLTPFLVGASGYSQTRFAAHNVFGALLWSIVVTLLGSMFGKALALMFGNIHLYLPWVFGTLVLLAIAVLIGFWFKSRKVPRQ